MMTDSPPRAIAAAVLLRAVKDAYGSSVPACYRQSAQRFLHPENPEYHLYCDALDLDPQALLEAVKRNGRRWFDRKFPLREKEIA